MSASSSGSLAKRLRLESSLLYFFPVLIILVTGFKTESTASRCRRAHPAQRELPLTFAFTLENYQTVLDRNFWPFFQNSLFVVSVSTLLVVLLALPCAYALTWREHERRQSILFFFLSTKFLPAVGVIMAIYYVAKTVTINGHNMIDEPATLILMYTAMNLPIAIWMLRSFLAEIPKDVLDASRVDGANTRQELPASCCHNLSRLVATAFICAIFAWNEFFLASRSWRPRVRPFRCSAIGFVTYGPVLGQALGGRDDAMLPVVIIGWFGAATVGPWPVDGRREVAPEPGPARKGGRQDDSQTMKAAVCMRPETPGGAGPVRPSVPTTHSCASGPAASARPMSTTVHGQIGTHVAGAHDRRPPTGRRRGRGRVERVRPAVGTQVALEPCHLRPLSYVQGRVGSTCAPTCSSRTPPVRAMSEYALIRADFAHPLPDSASYTQARCASRLRGHPLLRPDGVAPVTGRILGAGPIGLTAIMAARQRVQPR
jgi:sorbitol/mannitol transport system permease protein